MSIESTSVVTPSGVDGPSRCLTINNVAELRLLFAGSVMLSHAAVLSNPDGHRLLRTILSSDAAVQGFFILSGFLVWGSYSRISTPLTFYKRRLLRIFPAYLVAVLLFLGLGLLQAILKSAPIDWGDLPLYLAANITTLNFFQPEVGGVFAENPLQPINGALWSIKVELMFYALLPLLYWIAQRVTVGVVAAVLIIGGTLYWPVISWVSGAAGLPLSELFRYQLPGQIHFFGLGIALYAFTQGKIGRRALAAIVLLALALLFGLGSPRDSIQALALVLIIGALGLLPQLPDAFRGQDLSYGLYLSHFPIIQLLIGFNVNDLPHWLYTSLAVAIATAYAFTSWRLIERPALEWGRRS